MAVAAIPFDATVVVGVAGALGAEVGVGHEPAPAVVSVLLAVVAVAPAAGVDDVGAEPVDGAEPSPEGALPLAGALLVEAGPPVTGAAPAVGELETVAVAAVPETLAAFEDAVDADAGGVPVVAPPEGVSLLGNNPVLPTTLPTLSRTLLRTPTAEPVVCVRPLGGVAEPGPLSA